MARTNIASAINDFHRARRRANLEQLLSRVTGQPDQLLSFEEVRRKLRGGTRIDIGLQEVPLDSIIGSVGRYRDFTRSFLPKEEINEHRWANLKVITEAGRGLPPVELYKIGDAYFVADGNHRVSIARQLNQATIQAFVYDLPVRVSLSPDTSLDDLIIKEQYLQFLDNTRIDVLLPDVEFIVTAPGKYPILEDHIRVHHYYMGLDLKRDVSWEEAVQHWYETIYTPVIQLVREKGMMRDFPDRTETDFYIWLADHRAELADRLGWELETDEAVTALTEEQQTPLLTRMSEIFWDALTPDGLESGPPIGQWRRERLEPRSGDYLFEHILVPIGGDEGGWRALQMGLRIAQREEGQVRGLHIVTEESEVDRINQGFQDAVWFAGVPGRLAFEKGEIARKIVSRARWSDLIVFAMNNPPEDQILSRLSSGLRTILLRSPVPVLLVPGEATEMERPLLAFDGSPKAREALYVATYLAGRWQLPLTVIVVQESDKLQADLVQEARSYLEQHAVEAEFILEKGDAATNILVTAEGRGCDLLIMGGYGESPLTELFTDSTVNAVLRSVAIPTMVCR